MQSLPNQIIDNFVILHSVVPFYIHTHTHTQSTYVEVFGGQVCGRLLTLPTHKPTYTRHTLTYVNTTHGNNIQYPSAGKYILLF